ncbi:condensation domain-containing protein [Okeania sp. SIO1F9]|uniref:condensation domain-containing protein n=1 Tax=Okeania sp. SIO1F9 TaxID=2607813 RepID=UPI00338F47A6
MTLTLLFSLFDRDLQPVPIGVTGELHIGGAGLARGYLNRPELTAERFIPNPFENNSKLYKTGDLGRYLPDGNIEYIGRIDNQVKVRGYRIETGEIESNLTQHPSVKQIVVLAREDNSGNKSLVAYLVLESETPELSQTESIGKLKHYLKQRLPEYMIPSWFVVLPQLPLTPNGKVDRKALPVPNVASSVSTEYVAPQTETQKVLAEIWKAVLGIEKVGIHDHFFDLGGHSLMATQVVSRVRQTFNIELPLTKLFENSELVSLSQEIEVYLAQSQRIETVAIQPRDKNENPPPLSYPQQRLWFIEKMDLSSNAYNQPLTLHLVGKVDYVALQKSINQIIARHETLRTTFSEINGTPVQIIKPPFELQLPIQDLSGLTPSEQTAKLQQLLQQENEQTFNLEINPPIRAQLIKLETIEHILQITLHHIASDGWSLTVLFKELSAIYTATLEDQPSPLPQLPIQYADFAVWQRNYLQGETLETQLNYWKQKLQDLPQLQLPTDHPRPPVQTFNGGGIPINISAAVTSKVKQLSQKQGTTLFMTLLAVFKVLLFRYSGQESIVVGTAIANRNRTEIEGLIGFFVNSLVMYTDLGENPSFTEVLNRVKQTALEAYTHQDIPFEKLVEELQPERSLSKNPLFQVMFAVQQEEIFKSSFNLPNLELSWYEGTGAEMTVRMDLELHLWLAGDEIKGFCAYNRDLFEVETISRMLSDYQNLLSAAVETPEQPISQLPLMTESERDEILVERNNKTKDDSADKFIHQLFEEQAKKTSDVFAVVPDSISVSREYVAPQTQTQKILAEIWQEVLGIEKVGIYDNFFDLGGHSLTAVKLVSQICRNFNISLSVKTLFLHPIIAELSNIITELLNNKSVSQQQSSQSIKNDVQETLKDKFVQTKNSEYVQFESRSLLSLFAVGKIPPVDAVALGYLGEYDAEIFDFSRDYIIENIFENLPFWVMVKQTNWGRIAIIILPQFISDLYSNQDDTVQVTIEALEMARIIGAKFVSLTGLIPSATDYGLAINKAIANRQDLPKITTGHRTTGAAVVLTIKKICEEGGRYLSTEKVGFLGLGSVGMNVLPLMLKCLPHPQEITLCDVYSKWELLENIQQDLVQKFGFKGQINLALSKTTVPEEIYESSLIVGATNVPDVLDIMQVKPGTLIVDDSGPHCFSVEETIQRFQEREDILFSEGGMLRSPFPIKTTVYLPPSLEKIMNNAQKAAVFNSNPFNIMGCVFSSLLSSQFEQLEPTVGICDGEQSQLHYQILQELEFEAGDLHCEHYVLPAKSIANFRQRFGFAYGKSYG